MSPHPITPQEAAKLYGKTVNHIYRLANYHEWRRIRIDGRVYYEQQEVDRTIAAFDKPLRRVRT